MRKAIYDQIAVIRKPEARAFRKWVFMPVPPVGVSEVPGVKNAREAANYLCDPAHLRAILDPEISNVGSIDVSFPNRSRVCVSEADIHDLTDVSRKPPRPPSAELGEYMRGGHGGKTLGGRYW